MSLLLSPITDGTFVSNVESVNTQRDFSIKWDELPEDLTHKIFDLLGKLQDHVSFAVVCKRWSTIYFRDGLLDVSFYPSIRNSQLIALVNGITKQGKSITSVNLSGCTINERGLKALKNCRLVHCNIEKCRVDFPFLKALHCHSSLKELRLPGISRTSSYLTLDQIPEEELNPLNRFKHVETLYIGQRRLSREIKAVPDHPQSD